MSSHSLLKDIHDGSYMWSIIVRVMRKCNVYQKSSPTVLFCVSMLLIDAEGNKIQGSIITQAMHEKYNQGTKEGRTYEFENFIVSPNSYKYRPTTYPYKITFTTYTYFCEEPADLPMYSYSFKSIREIINLPQDENVDHLIDILGFVKSMGSLDDFNSQDGSTKPFLRMTLSDLDDNEIECVLFDQCASDTCQAQMQNTDTTTVALINLGRVTWTEDKHRQIVSSFAATRVYFNHDIPEVKELIDSVKDRGTPITMQFSQSMPTQRSRVSGHSLHGQPKVTIDKIKEQSIGDAFIVGCQLVKFETKFGWKYDGCSKCSSILKLLDDKVANNSFYSPGCKKAPNKVEPKMRLTYIVKDDTGSATLTFWDNLAVQLLNKTAVQMVLELPERKQKEGFPKDLQDQVGKRLLCKLKLNDYNKRNPGSSVSACEFTICEDLLGEFNSASSGVSGASAKFIELPHDNKESSYCDSKNHAIDLSEEDTPTTNVEQLNQLTSSKGKRCISSTKRAQKDGTPNTGGQSSTTIPGERMLKNVKQEKP